MKNDDARFTTLDYFKGAIFVVVILLAVTGKFESLVNSVVELPGINSLSFEMICFGGGLLALAVIIVGMAILKRITT
jgi:hypothetical protein